MRRTHPVCLLMILFISACATTAKPEKTQLEIREFQTRTYDTNNDKMVLKAVLNVLQDDGFIVKNANTDLGLLVAEKEVDIQRASETFFKVFFARENARYAKIAKTESTVNVSQIGKTCKVRVNFLFKSINNKGEPIRVHKIEDPEFYEEFFAKVDKGIFIQKEGM